MPKFSKATLESHDYGPVLDHQAEVDGYTVNITSFNHDIDATPLMKGLPDDRCDCPHWGYVVKGKLTFRYADHDEVLEAGDAFYLPPGHIPVATAGTEYVQFSPSAPLAKVAANMQRNMQAMQSA